jgi:ABC-type oligopeptide transport system substrate-binding subunit
LKTINWVLPKSGEDTWAKYNNGQIDLTFDLPFEKIAQGLKNGEVTSGPLLTNYYYEINVKKKPLNDKRIRQALSYALNREDIVKDYLQGGQNPSKGLIPGGMPDSAPGQEFRQNSAVKLPDNNTSEARKLLEQSGFPKGKPFPKLELLVTDDPGHKYLAGEIGRIWKNELGIDVKVTALKWDQMIQRMENRNYDLALMGWSADYADPSVFLKKYTTRSSNNHTGWSNSAYDLVINQAATSTDEGTRMKALHKAEDILLQELPVLPIYDYTQIYAAKKGVKGVFVSPMEDGIDFKWAYRDNA